MMKLRSSIFVAASLAACAAWAADAPFVGAWKMDPAKSRLTDQMKVENTGGSKFTFDFGGGPETVIADGTDQPAGNVTTLAVTLEGPDSLRVVRKREGVVILTAEWKLSRDGKTLSDDFTSFQPDREPSNLKYVYQRMTESDGFTGTWESARVKINFDLTIKIQPYAKDGLAIISPFSDKPKDLSFDGKDTPNLSSSAPAGSTYSAKRIDGRTVEITDKVDGKTIDTQQYQLSADLKTLTLTLNRTGKPTPDVFVFGRL